MHAERSPDGRGTLLQVKVVPNASRTHVAGPFGDGVRIQVAVQPERGRANEAMIEILAEALGLTSGAISILRGAGSPRKTVMIVGMAPDEVERRLSTHM